MMDDGDTQEAYAERIRNDIQLAQAHALIAIAKRLCGVPGIGRSSSAAPVVGRRTPR